MNLKLLKDLSYSFIVSFYILKCLRKQCANIIQRTEKDGQWCIWSLPKAVSDPWSTGGHFSFWLLASPLTNSIVTDRT